MNTDYSAPTIYFKDCQAKVRRTGIFVENESKKIPKLRQERHLLLVATYQNKKARER